MQIATYSLGLSKQPLYIFIAQGASKLICVKFGGPKDIAFIVACVGKST